MINKIEEIFFASILKESSSLASFPKPFSNKIILIDSLDEFSDSDERKIHGVLYYSDLEVVERDEAFLKLVKKFYKLPIIHVGNSITDLTPRVRRGLPFFTINKKDLLSKRVTSVLLSMPQFKAIIGHQGALLEDVDATKLIADLNIDRLHKTLKDLEAERQKTEQANKSKQLFLAGVTHELRTPLTAIHGFADLFRLNNLTKDQKHGIAIIKEASSNLLNIVNDLLNYSKITDGKLTIFNEPFTLYSAVKTVYELLKQNATEKNLNFQFEFLVDKELRVMGDRFRLKQVLTNLISNAVKFTDKGSIILTVSKSLGNNLIFSVKDTGLGIKQEKLNDIFESYVQAEDYTSQEYGGTGLGLAIVKELVNLQGGTISVKSELNFGSEFSFQLSLPIVQGVVKEEDVEDSSQLDLSNLSILAVEDNHLNQMLIQKLLGTKVKTLQIAGDGIKAISLTDSVKFDVILMDLNLPKMSGMQVVEEIRKGGMNVTTPVAVITANVWEEQLDLIKKNGIDTIIQKPFNRKDLYFQIYTLCNERTGDLITLTYLKQMSGGDHYFIRDVLITYQKNILEDMIKLSHAVSEDDDNEARTIAHKMKSSFRMLEMKEACEICEEIELASKNTSSVNLVKVLKLIIDKSLLEAEELVKKYSD